MARETMTSTERLEAAIRLERPDRVPIVPSLTVSSAAHLVGISRAEAYADWSVGLNTILKTYDSFGGWDAFWNAGESPETWMLAVPMKVKVPGKDLPDDYVLQMVEEEVIKPEDYDTIAEVGWAKFYFEDCIFRICDAGPEDISQWARNVMARSSKMLAETEERGVSLLSTAIGVHPFFLLSLGRSMLKFTEDLYYEPEKVERALRRMTTDLIETAIPRCKALGAKRAWIVEERAGGFFYPPKVFERFWWPYTQEIVEALWSEGIVLNFHLDTCWDKNIPYFKKLPKGSYILELDSTTDIFAAKEIVRGHGCIHGDVPPTIYSLGKPEDVEDYVKKLIDEVGGDGGFILGCGCSTAADAKPENFRAMLETGKNYEFSKK